MAYTNRDIKKMIDVYSDNPNLQTVDRLATLLNKPRRSIISKLVKEGVYITRGYRSKTGEVPISKLAIVRTIEDALDTKLPGLDKAPKSTLRALERSVLDTVTLLEDSLEEIKGISEVSKIRDEMLAKSRKNDDPMSILSPIEK